MHNDTYKWYEKLSVFYLTFALVLEAYGYGGFLNFSRFISFILITVCIVMLLNKKNLFNNIPYSLNIYFYLLFIVALFSLTSISDAIPFGQIEQYILVIAIFSFIRYDKFITLYKKFAYVCVCFSLFQYVFYMLVGVKITGMLEFLPLDLGLEDSSAYFQHVTGDLGRASAFFSEPAKYAQYIMPLLVIEIFSANNRKKWFKVILITTSLIFTESGNGIIMLGIVYIAYIINRILSVSGVVKTILILVFIIGTPIVTALYLKTEHGTMMLERRNELNSDFETSSGYIRIQRGYYVFDEYTTLEKIIGINNINKFKKRIASSKAYFTFAENDYYANTFQKFLLNTGIIGAVMFFVIMFGLMRNNTPEGKTIAWLFTIMSFFSAAYLSTIMYLYMYIAYKMKENKLSYKTKEDKLSLSTF